MAPPSSHCAATRTRSTTRSARRKWEQILNSVVDPETPDPGVNSLHVADASVIPSLIRGHTNAPAIVVGEVAADLIRGR